MSADPRDKVFALLGLSKDFDWISSGTIDYGMDAESTYIKFAVDHTRKSDDFGMLSYYSSESIFARLAARTTNWRGEMNRCAQILSSWNKEYKVYRDSDGNISFRDRILSPSYHYFEAQEEYGLLPVFNSYYHRIDSLPSESSTLNSQLREHHDVVALTLSTWVPSWQCYLSALYEPRVIIEILGSHAPVPSCYQPFHCDNFRKWGSHGGKKALTVHGRVLGSVGLLLSSSCLLGRVERNFERIRQASESQAPSSKAPSDAQVLCFWSHLLDCSADLETDGDSMLENDGRIITLLERMAGSGDALEMKISQRISQIPETVRSKHPGAHSSAQSPWYTFLPYMDINTCPPKPGTIEAHLVDRARRTVNWSDGGNPAMEIVKDSISIVDRRLIGLYRSFEIEAPSHCVGPKESSEVIPGDTSNSLKLALLPPQPDFRDLVVWFPGAKIPFVVRRMPEFPSDLYSAAQYGQDGNEDNLQTERLSEGLVFVDGTEEHLACELVGFHWINDFEEIARKEIKPDHVFHIF
ncbi:putative Heterokaryon incompatibility protein-domain-containing protein [Seiridium cardinale]|uniref:Heterokaryon incompatibility protein-domain-containing protein n=1 Tax=Seiridium cardinale TaxID=138064 RepID=A0ABR2XWK4_9PEZI